MMAMPTWSPRLRRRLTAAVAWAAIAEGVIVLTCGTYGNAIRFLPPLTISTNCCTRARRRRRARRELIRKSYNEEGEPPN